MIESTPFVGRLRFPLAALLASGLFLSAGCGTEADRDGTVTTSRVITTNPDAVEVSKEAREEHAKSGYAFGPISVTRATEAEEARSGEEYTYTLTVANNSDAMLHNVKVIEAVTGGFDLRSGMIGESKDNMVRPANMQELSPEIQAALQPQPQAQTEARTEGGTDQAAAQAPTPFMIPIGMLGPNSQVTVKLTGLPTSGESFDTCTYVDYTPSICSTVAIARPEWVFGVMVTDAEGNPIRTAYVCDPIYLRYFAMNTGDAATKPITVTQTLPQGFTTEDGESEISLEGDAIEPGGDNADPVYIGDLMLIKATGPGTFYATASATDGSINRADDTDRVTLVKPELNVTIDGPAQVSLAGGAKPNYTVRVTNVSDNAIARDTVVALNLPEGTGRDFRITDTREVSYEDGRFQVGTIDPGESRAFRFEFTPIRGGDLAMTASASAYCADAVTQELTTNVLASPSFQFEVVDSADPVVVGQNVVYTIEAYNEGNAASNLNVTAELPEGLEFVSGEGTTNVTGSGRTLTIEPIANMAPDKQTPAQWTVTAKATSEGKKSFRVVFTSDGLDKPYEDEEPTNVDPALNNE